MKHSVLIACLEYLGQKDKAYTYIDTHAGAGGYSLDEGFAAKNREWLSGVDRVINNTPDLRLLERYREIADRFLNGSNTYPGSPLIAAELMREDDRAFCYELHPADYEILSLTLEQDRRFKILKADGPREFLSLLPPPSRRACILIDPSYEIKSDYSFLEQQAAAALKRFPGGVYIIWYPLLEKKEAAGFPDILMSLYDGNRCRIEIQFTEKSPSGWGMFGCGLVIYNPPWVLKDDLDRDLPRLAKLLGGPSGLYRMDWEEG